MVQILLSVTKCTFYQTVLTQPGKINSINSPKEVLQPKTIHIVVHRQQKDQKTSSYKNYKVINPCNKNSHVDKSCLYNIL